MTDWRERALAAEASKGELEAALREIAEWEGFTADCCDCMEDVVAVARAVLAGTPERRV